MVLFVCLLALLGAADAKFVTRRAKKQSASALRPQTMQIGTVPVYNYDKAYMRKSAGMSLAEMASEHWVFVMKDGTTDEQVEKLCVSSKALCEKMGHPSENGVPFFEVYGSEQDLEELLESADDQVSYIE